MSPFVFGKTSSVIGGINIFHISILISVPYLLILNIVSFKNHRQKSPVQEYGGSSADLLAWPRPHSAAVRPAVGGQEVFRWTVTAHLGCIPGGFKLEQCFVQCSS